MIDVNTPIEVTPAPAKSSLETALIALGNRTSQVVHLSPSQAEALLTWIGELERFADSVFDDDLKELGKLP